MGSGNIEEEEFDSYHQHAGKSQEKIIFFSIFSKSNAKMNHDIMFRKKFYKKPKLSSARRMATLAQDNKKSDIRTFFKFKTKLGCDNDFRIDQLEDREKVSSTPT